MSSITVTNETPYYPLFAALEVTLRCNMQCLHCGSKAPSARKDELSLDEWKDVVDQLIDLKAGYIVLSGGEPFVWKHWRELASYIAEHGNKFSIISNGYSINEDDAKFMGDIGISILGLSVDGMEKTHNKIRNIDDAFERVINSIRLVKKAGVKVTVITSVNKMNFGDLDELYHYLEDLGVDVWQVQIVNAFGRAGEMKDEMIITREQYVQLVDKIFGFQKESGRNNRKMKVVPADTVGYCYGPAKDVWGDLEWNGCNAGRYVIGIRSNGDVSGCLSLQDDSFISGNVRKRKLAEIWADDSAFAYSRIFDKSDLKGACEGCKFGEVCRGGCLGMGHSVTGERGNNPYCYYGILKK